MDKKQSMLVMIGACIAFLAITTVIAGSRTSNTPLYTYRMEQASYKMNFLPTRMNGFVYETEEGCVLDCGGCGIQCEQCGDVKPLNPYTCATCDEYYCENPSLCYGTCYSTCSTCSGNTCDETSCQNTCSTCQQYTCYYYTCWYPTCDWETCYYYTCFWPTCYDC
jgi:hypothetical protein